MKKKFAIWTIVIMLIGLFLFSRKELFIDSFFSEKPAMSFPEKLENKGCLGLNYHRVLDSSLVNKFARWLFQSKELVDYSVLQLEFQEQIKALKKAGAVFLSEDQLLEAKAQKKFPDKCVWISFDDIDQSVYENAFPILKEAEVPFTLFVIAGHVGDKDFSNLEMATWDELRDMKKSGLASFGSHTYDMHRFEDEVPVFLLPSQAENFSQDLAKSVTTIEKELDVTVKSFAYPYGDTNDLVTRLVEEQGLTAGYILAPQSIRPEDSVFLLNRIIVNQATFNDTLLPYLQQN